MRLSLIARVFAVAVITDVFPVVATACDCSQAGDFLLWHVGSTTTQIAIAWQPVLDAGNYILERTISCDFSRKAGYNISAAVTAYGDTGQPPDDPCRFPAGNQACWPPTTSVLDPGVDYTYRIRAIRSGGDLLSNCMTAQVATGPVRGRAGDLWADTVLGKPDFGQNAFLKTNERTTQSPGGVLIDKSRRPSRVYVADASHNRVLGFDHLGTCAGQACTDDSDCAEGTCQFGSSELVPQIVLGQDSMVDKSACNGDGTGQLFPARAPASATSMCMIVPTQMSMGETIFSSLMDTDHSGALYVPDIYNNRVLRFADPFVSQVADAVWGQDDFGGNECNKGLSMPSCRSLCLEHRHAGVAVDHEGNLWVADPENYRVLRFPKCPRGGTLVCDSVAPGQIASEADVVLGQPNCTSRIWGEIGRPLNQFAYPLDVAFDRAARVLYVADAGDERVESRILKFTADAATGDFVTGMSGAALPLSFPQEYPGTAPQLCYKRPIEVAVDTQTSGLWVRQDADLCVELVDVETGRPSHTVHQFGGPIRGIDVDRSGNLFVTDAWYGLARLERMPTGMGSPQHLFGGSPDGPGGAYAADSMVSGTGAVVLSDPARVGPDQLIVGDGFRMLIWTSNDLSTLVSGQDADDLYGAADFDDGSMLFQQFFYYPQVSGGRLWVEKGREGELLSFDYPLCGAKWQQSAAGCTTPSAPARSIPLGPANGFVGYPVLGSPGVTVRADPPDPGDVDFAFTSDGDAVWVADRLNSRVFRISGLNGSSPYVDVILGQANATDHQCNRGLGSPRGDTLCVPYDVAVDPMDNLYVTDNGGETGTNHRLLEFDAGLFTTPSTALFGVPATRVFGTGGDFDVFGGPASRDPAISPFKAILHPLGPMVVLNNPYSSQRFPVVYMNPLRDQLPQLILGDFMSYPAMSGSIDRAGNLYTTDYDWSRVLIYKNPFGKLRLYSDTGCIGDCDTDGAVTVDELVLGINIALGRAGVQECLTFDMNNDGRVTVGELIAAVRRALNGCD